MFGSDAAQRVSDACTHLGEWRTRLFRSNDHISDIAISTVYNWLHNSAGIGMQMRRPHSIKTFFSSNPLQLDHVPDEDFSAGDVPQDSLVTDSEPTNFNPPFDPGGPPKLKCPKFPPPPEPADESEVFDDLKDLLGGGANDLLPRIAVEYEKMYTKLRGLVDQKIAVTSTTDAATDPLVGGSGSAYSTLRKRPDRFHEELSSRVREMKRVYAEFQRFLEQAFAVLGKKGQRPRLSRVRVGMRPLDPFALRAVQGELKFLDATTEKHFPAMLKPWQDGFAKLSNSHSFSVPDWDTRRAPTAFRSTSMQPRPKAQAGAPAATDSTRGASENGTTDVRAVQAAGDAAAKAAGMERADDKTNTGAGVPEPMLVLEKEDSPAAQLIEQFERQFGPIQETSKGMNKSMSMIHTADNDSARDHVLPDNGQAAGRDLSRGACQTFFEDILGTKLMPNSRELLKPRADEEVEKPLPLVPAGCPPPPEYVGKPAYPPHAIFPDPLARRLAQLSHDLWLLRSYLFLPNESVRARYFRNVKNPADPNTLSQIKNDPRGLSGRWYHRSDRNGVVPAFDEQGRFEDVRKFL
ncbi:unnamed protein product [Amoebophrya sp. A120]|nr:unnamed protein product [Amoebophrya sp. A120]|eukprot:GSA120T00017927001.1